MKVLFLNPPYLPYFIRSARWGAQSISGSNWYPIWLGYCTGLLEKKGHEVKLLDALVEGISVNETLNIVKDFKAEITVVYISSESLDNDLKIVEKIKELTGCFIVLVGPWCSVDSDNLIIKSNAINAIALREFDYTILELANGIDIENISGLWWKRNGEVVKNDLRLPIPSEKLDDFPFISDIYNRHLKITKYFQAPHLHPFIDMFTGRGCAWGRCTFCVWPFTITKDMPYRKRSIENVVEELKFIKKQLPFIKELFVQDDTFPRDRAVEFSQAILDNNIKIIWSCYARADLDYETLKIMKKAGCRCLHVGYESSNKDILKDIKKGLTVDQIEKFTEYASRLGFVIHADFIFGLPGDTVETIKNTIKWAKGLSVHSYQFTTPKPYPGTPYYDWLKKNGFLKDGKTNLPGLSSNDLSYWVKKGIRQCHFNFKYLKRMLKKPSEIKRLVRGGTYVVINTFLK